MRSLFLAAGITLVGCSTSSAGTGSCHIDGIYAVTSTQTGGTCTRTPADTSDVSVQDNGDGTATLFLPGVTGGCPGKLQGCALTSNCEFHDASGNVLLAGSVSWTFSATGLTGSESLGFHPPLKPTSCTASFDDTGTKK